METINIISGKKGYHLKVNGMYISHGFGNEIKAIRNKLGIPYGATEWISIHAIKRFWYKYMPFVISSTNYPYESVWGTLKLIKPSGRR